MWVFYVPLSPTAPVLSHNLPAPAHGVDRHHNDESNGSSHNLPAPAHGVDRHHHQQVTAWQLQQVKVKDDNRKNCLVRES